ncbi:hypothetical protein [Burkholderia contaminans]|uniref:Uncharacterized protein n=1 Tax=Burkholderia contaminans TaxID=488447 RepID=A0A2S5DMI0_9BURK|nr:hypothetical protein [Burkholderia contaminans]POZ80287.1 hypothetical protein C3743_39430 [Burkholderia contaminans]
MKICSRASLRSIKVEAVPGYRLSYAGDPTKDDNASYKLIDDVKKGRNIHYQQVFGKEAQGYASVILPGIARNDSISGFSPINILAGDPGVFARHAISDAEHPARGRTAAARRADVG